jgi:sugar phosphate isomerase/epimerase
MVAERRGVKIGLECHSQYSKTPDGLDRIYHLVSSPAIGINLDTGNAYLAGQDPYAWFERVVERSVHLHAKDISDAHSDAERGKVTGTPVGCACGDGVIDWKRMIDIARRCPRDIVFSVECGSIEQAARSIEHLRKLL